MKKKVVHLLYSKIYSGAENVVLTIIENMENKYDDIESVYVSPKGSIEDVLKDRGVNYALMDRFSISELKRIKRELKPGIVHAHDFIASVMATLVFKDCRIISHLHNNVPWLKKKNIFSRVYLNATKRIDTILEVSTSVERDYVYSDRIKDKLICVGNPINCKSILDKVDEYDVSERYDVIYLGRFTEQKNPELISEIISDLYDENKSYKFAFVGDGELREKFELSLKERGSYENSTFYGFKKNPYPILANAKVLLMPSLWEGFGLVAVEALSLGVPVVCSGAGGLKNIVTDECGLVAGFDKKDYLDEIRRLLSDDEYYNAKSNGARERATSLENIDSYIEKIHTIYEG